MSPPPEKRTILLVNPWIHDFAAYDLWMKPLGLLYIGSILRSRGYGVHLLDCLHFASLPSPWRESGKPPRRRDFGCGHFYKEEIPKPQALRGIRRRFRRYGNPPEAVRESLAALPRPDLILMTSSMTYWYGGVFEAIAFLRRHLPGVPILLGGIYATLCPDHARIHSGADRILPGPWDEGQMRVVADTIGGPAAGTVEGFAGWPYPAFDLYREVEYACLLTRSGCPFSCTYCASSKLAKGWEARPPERVAGEIAHWREKLGVQDFAFYDDALLIDFSRHLLPILRQVMERRLRVRFHTPNALHVKEIDEESAGWLFQGGFKTIRLGLETASEVSQAETGGKVDNRFFLRAVRSLKKAGYPGEQIGVYLLAGLPGQRAREVEESIAFVKDAGARPVLVEYSPIPGTPIFAKAKEFTPFDIENEPLFQNNSLFPCRWEGFTAEAFRRLKEGLTTS